MAFSAFCVNLKKVFVFVIIFVIIFVFVFVFVKKNIPDFISMDYTSSHNQWWLYRHGRNIRLSHPAKAEGGSLSSG